MEEARMRYVKLAQVIVPLRIDHEKFFLLRRNIKWNDWGLVGGHVEPNEKGRWKSTAIRECNEELAPLENGEDFLLFAIPKRPITWGPVESKSTGGTPTRYTSKFFSLKFLKSAEKCLNQLPADDFALIPEKTAYEIIKTSEPTDEILRIVDSALGGQLNKIPLPWSINIHATNINIRELR
jgi:8-oxo-dGTP pyrophosphatase MutT (NUDIX family)